MNSVAIRILALSLLGTVYLGAWCPAYASTGSCHQSCTAAWLAERKTAIDDWVACKAKCTHLSSHEKTACSVQCFQDKNAALTKANSDLHQCFGTCSSQEGTPCRPQCFQDKNAAFAQANNELHQCLGACQGTTGSCHRSCTAPWLAERKTAIRIWVACKRACKGLP
jgi:hypothetical protein